MKRYIGIFLLLTAPLMVTAQNSDDAHRLSILRPSGTARSLSLGNATGALGGDYSSINVNPAGIAVYRSSEFTFTPSLQFDATESNYYGNTAKDDKLFMPLQQIGFVGTYKPMYERATGIVSTHFGIGFTRTNSFKKSTFIQGTNINSSLLDEIIDRSNGLMPNSFDMQTKLAYDAYLIDPVADGADQYYHAFEEIDNGNVKWGLDNGMDQSRLLRESGSAGDFDISFGANFSNKFYLGGAVAISSFHYKKTLEHSETPITTNNFEWVHLSNYTFEDKLTSNGLGANLKVGAIYRPITALRLGASFHTPTLYSINDEYSSAVYLPKDFTDSQYYRSNGEYSYNFRTPYKAIGSLAYTFGNKGLISADYEFVDYTTMKFSSDENSIADMNYINSQNSNIKNTFKQTHNLRVGAEFRPTEIISLRAGYGLFQTPYKDNSNKHQTFSAGVGVKMNNMFVDVGYMLRQEKYIHSLYYSSNVENKYQQPANITTNLHQLAVTLGWRF